MTKHDPDGLETAVDFVRRLSDAGSPARPEKKRKKSKIRPRIKGDPEVIADVLPKVVTEQGWSKHINISIILGRWAQIVGPLVASKSRVTGYKDGVVQVSTESTAWAVQLRQLAPQIVAKLNEQLGDDVIQAIKVSGPDSPSWQHGRRRVSDGRGPRDTYG